MGRLEELTDWLDGRSAALVTSPESRRCLLGTAAGGVLLVTSEQSYFLADHRFDGKAPEGVRVVTAEDRRALLLEYLIKHDIRRVLVEADKMTIGEFGEYSGGLYCSEFDGGTELSEKLSAMRAIKSRDETDLIVKAQRINEKAFEHFLSRVRKGMTEKQAAALLNFCIVDCGADEPAFVPRVVSGANASDPDAVSSDKPISDGEFLTLHFGARMGGYYSLMSRTVAVGSVPPAMEEAYYAVSSACSDAVKTLRPSIVGKVADSVSRSTLNAWGGFEKYAALPLGHGIGLELREAPFLSKTGGTVLRAGMVVTVSPAVFVPGRFGIRIGDMAIITENGCADLTSATKNLIRV